MDAIEEERRRRFKEVSNASDPHGMYLLYEVVSTYRGQREDREGHHQDITIEIHFDGRDYHVEICDSRGRVAWGVHDPKLEEALDSIGWVDLDEDPRKLAERGGRASVGSWSQSDVAHRRP